MRYFNDTYNRRLWHHTQEARELLSNERLGLLEELAEHVDAALDVEESLSHIIVWSEYPLVDRLFFWLEQLIAVRSYGNPTFSPILEAVLWAFENHKHITIQTQHQAEISISLVSEIIKSHIYITQKKDARCLLMNLFIYSQRPDLSVRSIKKIIEDGDDLSMSNGAHYQITNFLFAEKPIPNFLFRYLDTCNKTEYEVVMKLLEGKSLRKILPPHLGLSKTENGLILQNKINFPDDCEDYILERYVVASKILKDFADDAKILNRLLDASKLFKGNFASFKEDITFWKSVFKFIVRNERALLDPTAFSHTVDFFEAQRYYCEHPLTYSLKGRTMASVIRAIDNWQINYFYKPEYLKYKWTPLPIEKWTQTVDKKQYIIEEISDGQRLSVESKTLHHCVFSYAEMCLRGKTHIFSLCKMANKRKKPFMTIEVTKDRITQIAGKYNSKPTELIEDIIYDWASHNNLSFK